MAWLANGIAAAWDGAIRAMLRPSARQGWRLISATLLSGRARQDLSTLVMSGLDFIADLR